MVPQGFVLSALGRNEEALEAFEKALFFDPGSSKILTSKGIVYFMMGLPEKALETFDEALAAEPRKASDWACKAPRFSFFSQNRAPVMSLTMPVHGTGKAMCFWNWGKRKGTGRLQTRP